MRRSKRLALVTAVVGVVLAVGDYTDLIDHAFGVLGIAVKFVPPVYIGLFACAWLLQRHSYEMADYQFCIDAPSDFLSEYEEGVYSVDTYRVCVENTGHVPIIVQVKLMTVTPLPSELRAKLGMPLIPIGAADSAPVQITPGDRRPFNLVSAWYPFTGGAYVLDVFRLWHTWQGAPTDINPCEYTFELLLVPAEGKPKSARYHLKQAPPLRGRAYDLVGESKPTLLGRWERWLESPVSGAG